MEREGLSNWIETILLSLISPFRFAPKEVMHSKPTLKQRWELKWNFWTVCFVVFAGQCALVKLTGWPLTLEIPNGSYSPSKLAVIFLARLTRQLIALLHRVTEEWWRSFWSSPCLYMVTALGDSCFRPRHIRVGWPLLDDCVSENNQS